MTAPRERMATFADPRPASVFGLPEPIDVGLDPHVVSFTDRLTRDLAALARAFDRGMPGETVAVAATRRWPAFKTFLDSRLDELASLLEPLSHTDAYVEHATYFRDRMAPFTAQSPFLARANARPRGYAGDSEMIRMIFDAEFRGDTVLGALLHHHPTQTYLAQAIRHRAGLVADLLAARRVAMRSRLRVMSLACGAARELRSLVEPNAKELELILCDQDPEALREAREEIALVERLRGVSIGARTEPLSVRDVLRGKGRALGQLDVIYAFGLFDYLPNVLAQKLVGLLAGRLAPRGVLVVGNVHTSCHTRAYLDTWMDWRLFYRGESDMIGLAADVGPGFLLDVDRDPTGSEQYLRVWSNAR